MKVWITKYALTSGVFVAEAKRCETVLDGNMVEVGRGDYLHGSQWQETEDAAIARVMTMIGARRKALAKESAKLDAMVGAIQNGKLPIKPSPYK